MSKKRVLSINSRDRVYHFTGCRHAYNVQLKSKMIVSVSEAEWNGYRPCKCCNNMNFRFKQEKDSLENYSKNKGIEFKLQAGIVYVRTEIGCWKIVYSKTHQYFVLYHRNASDVPIDFENPESGAYHRQTDEMKSDSLISYFRYIYRHDLFRKTEKENGGNLSAVRIDKKYAKSVRRREYSDRMRRIDCLFKQLEQENNGYREMSFC